jgi:hypothetical protein
MAPFMVTNNGIANNVLVDQGMGKGFGDHQEKPCDLWTRQQVRVFRVRKFESSRRTWVGIITVLVVEAFSNEDDVAWILSSSLLLFVEPMGLFGPVPLPFDTLVGASEEEVYP